MLPQSHPVQVFRAKQRSNHFKIDHFLQADDVEVRQLLLELIGVKKSPSRLLGLSSTAFELVRLREHDLTDVIEVTQWLVTCTVPC